MSNLIVGNWKMNGVTSSLEQVSKVVAALNRISVDADIVICPPFTLIDKAINIANESKISIGGQDCHTNEVGAHTGDISADMLADLGAKYVIVGHSERRQAYNETNSLVATKAFAASKAGLTPIVCVGEKLETRESGRTLKFISEQIAESIPDSVEITSLVIAYEPVWAIGTGRSAEIAQIEEVHAFIRAEIKKRYSCSDEDIRILYGGSVSPKNAKDIFAIPDVNGGLIGGASLRADSFVTICQCTS